MNDQIDPPAQQSGSEPARLFICKMKVHPTPDHPKFYEWQFAVLQMWLYARSYEEARDRATGIIAWVPYELADPEFSAGIPDDAPAGSNAWIKEEEARTVGFAMLPVPMAIGSDDALLDKINLNPGLPPTEE
jgi:hypothetical protein